MGREPAAGLQRRAPDFQLGGLLETPAAYPEGTYRVSELGRDLKSVLAEVYPSVWVAGEVQRLRSSSAGHLYFELVEKGRGDEIVGRLDCALFRRDLSRVRPVLRRSGQELEEGREIRCRGDLDFYPRSGRLQLLIRDVDAVFSLGLMARRRREILAQLAASGLVDRNRELEMAAVPLRIGLVTSRDSAAYHDFVTSLEESGYAFALRFLHAPVQGEGAARRVVRALAAFRSIAVDCVVVTRGGGSRSDLAAFDTLEVARAIAESPFPVLTGLGHEIDESIADAVAHAAFKTPTKVAEFLVQRVAAFEAELDRLAVALRRQGLRPLERSRHRLESIAARLPALGGRVATLAHRVERLRSRALAAGRSAVDGAHRRRRELAGRLSRASVRRLADSSPMVELKVRRIGDLAAARVREHKVRMTALERLCHELGPERVLARGFSLTRREDGRLVRRAAELAMGETITTRLAEGSLASRVERLMESENRE